MDTSGKGSLESDDLINNPIEPDFIEDPIEFAKPKFQLTSKALHHLFLFLTTFIPFVLITFCFIRSCLPGRAWEFWWSSLFMTSIGFSMTLALVRGREKKLKLSVELLVEERLRDYQSAPVLDNSKNLETEMLKARILEIEAEKEHHGNLLQSSVAKAKEKVIEINFELDRKNEELKLLTFENNKLKNAFEHEVERVQLQKVELDSALQHKESLLAEYLETIREQRKVIEKKQALIGKLESKIHDLMYEIRSLLQLDETSIGSVKSLTSPLNYLVEALPVNQPTVQSFSSLNNFDLSTILQKCIKIAENESGITHLGYLGGKLPRFLDLSLDYSPLDLRSLFEKFRDETKGIVALCDPGEQKVLLVNSCVKEILGWNSEKFVKDFPDLVIEGLEEWQKKLATLCSQKESHLEMTLKTKNDQEVLFKVHLGLISKGPFSSHALVLLT